jgi:uncharacterized OB-fold protein
VNADGNDAEVPCINCGRMYVGPHIFCPECWAETIDVPADDRNIDGDDDE